MRNTNKKGFTIVELVIVVAVIAILAAVLIPTFSGIIRKANISSDIVLAKNLNTALATNIDNTDDFAAAYKVLENSGYTLDNLNAKADGNWYAWDKDTNQIIYLDETFAIIYNAKDLNNKSANANWIIAVTNSDDAKAVTDAGCTAWNVKDNVNTAEGLKYALSVAEKGEVIKLVEDLSFEKSSGGNYLLGGDNVTIDLNGHTITYQEDQVRFYGKGLVLKNGTFKSVDARYVNGKGRYGIILENYAEATIEDVVVEGGINAYWGGKVTINNSTVTAYHFYAVIAQRGAVVEVNNSTLNKVAHEATETFDKGNHLIYVQDAGKTTGGVPYDASSITLTGCTLNYEGFDLYAGLEPTVK